MCLNQKKLYFFFIFDLGSIAPLIVSVYNKIRKMSLLGDIFVNEKGKNGGISWSDVGGKEVKKNRQLNIWPKNLEDK